MNKLYFSLLFSVIYLALGFRVDKPAYVIYDQAGKQTGFETMMEHLDTVDIILFGELHNNAMAHWLELQVLKSAYEKKHHITIGAEMFETDNQLLIDEYLQGTITLQHMEREAKLWDNYPTDYQPLLSFAGQHQLSFVATNVPRRYASLVAREGMAALDSLPEQAKQYMAPLPVEIDLNLPGYQRMLQQMGGGAHGSHGGSNAEHMVQAQALKDATMAHAITTHYTDSTQFIHFNGSYHSDHFEGIYWYLKQTLPDISIATISCVEAADVQQMPEATDNLANFIIAIPEDMAKSY